MQVGWRWRVAVVGASTVRGGLGAVGWSGLDLFGVVWDGDRKGWGGERAGSPPNGISAKWELRQMLRPMARAILPRYEG